jgi:hypothetical protein
MNHALYNKIKKSKLELLWRTESAGVNLQPDAIVIIQETQLPS